MWPSSGPRTYTGVQGISSKGRGLIFISSCPLLARMQIQRLEPPKPSWTTRARQKSRRLAPQAGCQLWFSLLRFWVFWHRWPSPINDIHLSKKWKRVRKNENKNKQETVQHQEGYCWTLTFKWFLHKLEPDPTPGIGVCLTLLGFNQNGRNWLLQNIRNEC